MAEHGTGLLSHRFSRPRRQAQFYQFISFRVSPDSRQGISWAVFSTGLLAKEFTFKIPLVWEVSCCPSGRATSLRLWLRAWVSCWLLAGGHPPHLKAALCSLSCGFLYRQLITWQLASSRPVGKQEWVSSQKEFDIMYTVMKVNPPSPLLWSLGKKKETGAAAIKGRGWYNVQTPAHRVCGAPLRSVHHIEGRHWHWPGVHSWTSKFMSFEMP